MNDLVVGEKRCEDDMTRHDTRARWERKERCVWGRWVDVVVCRRVGCCLLVQLFSSLPTRADEEERFESCEEEKNHQKKTAWRGKTLPVSSRRVGGCEGYTRVPVVGFQ